MGEKREYLGNDLASKVLLRGWDSLPKMMISLICIFFFPQHTKSDIYCLSWFSSPDIRRPKTCFLLQSLRPVVTAEVQHKRTGKPTSESQALYTDRIAKDKSRFLNLVYVTICQKTMYVMLSNNINALLFLFQHFNKRIYNL